MSSTVVGALACQKNSFLKTFQTSVVSSREYVPLETSRDKQNKNQKKKKVETPHQVKYAVELKDTILFPEGGGQPFDMGTIKLPTNEVIEVQSVLRDKLTALHITDKPVAPGTEVTLNVDWKRRIDFMQQHTGQHLLSAVFDTYNLETLSWSMGEMINYIELPEKVSDDIVNEVNEKVNDLILEGLPISVSTPDAHGGEIDTSHIPDDYDLSKGIIRVVKIGDLDTNPCCGTHLSSTSQIQAISLLHQTNVRGGHSRLHFLCGSRVYQYLRQQNQILKNVSGNYLSCQIEEVPEKVEALNANYRKSQSRESTLLKELAAIEASKVFEKFSKSEKLVDFIYKPENNPEFITLAQKELATLINTNTGSGVDLTDKQTLILFNGDYPSGTGGMVKVLGPKAEEVQTELKKRISNLKGGGKGTSFQGKIGKYEKGEIESVFSYLENLE
ncbi:alanyl-tRNA synthetase [Suhomyces tanzawaensis NRRL Y-17324]|uniref:Alanyl-tRNA synthetase n=1 Tax=Suhomyces tanzawaensis NRRL Y-17324 TaxID=984487 RepID=A0A1E4SFH5_9ASCO|nr:alanyl-tRNA synthetase [Suhomyces tanzawaensis NRRL Y-17324]ODV78263.1 alanyl-tRNA synthetase [Suhomyces tanzawaensis NRRL Y-17324]